MIGDQTGTTDLDRAYRVLERGVAVMNEQDVDIVIHTGDLVESTRAPDEIRADFARGTAILDRLNRPWRMALGDHEVQPPGERLQGSTDRSREQLFLSLYQQRVPDAQQPYYFFDYEGVRFIALYSHDTLHAEPRWGVVFMAAIADPQLDWLEGVLNDPDRPRDVVVFIHQPLWYQWSGWSRVHELLARHHVRAVIAGHLHYPQADATVDGIAYIVVGSTGGDTKTGSESAGDLRHVSVVTLTPDSVDWRLVGVDPENEGETIPARPRGGMERAQAVSSMLWSLVWTPPDADAPCAEGYVIPRLGNPTDVPLRITIGGADFGEYHPELCSEVSDGACVIPPARGMATANTSTVGFSVRPTFAPAWRAPAPISGATTAVSITATFDWNGETYRIDHSLEIAPRTCPAP